MTNPDNPSNWSDPTYQPPQPAQPWPDAPASGTAPQTGYTYGDQSAYPTTTPSYPQPYYPPQPGYAPGQPYAQPQYVPQPTNGLAIAAMIVSIVGFGPVGAIMGHIARRQIRERGEQGDGFALAGIIVGWAITAFWVLCCGFYAVGFGFLGWANTAT
jgi:hypothetical protein